MDIHPCIFIISISELITFLEIESSLTLTSIRNSEKYVKRKDLAIDAINDIVKDQQDFDNFIDVQNLVREAINEPLKQIVEVIRLVLERTPAELAADIVDRGITLAGGGSLLRNLDVLLRQATGLPVVLAEDPLTAVVVGSGRILDRLDLFKDVTLQ